MEAATNAFHAQTGKETAMTTVMFGGNPDQEKLAEIRRVLARRANEAEDVGVGNINSERQLVLSGVKSSIDEM
jgi:malonyl CoA-acyl carrier protein transacylase